MARGINSYNKYLKKEAERKLKLDNEIKEGGQIGICQSCHEEKELHLAHNEDWFAEFYMCKKCANENNLIID